MMPVCPRSAGPHAAIRRSATLSSPGSPRRHTAQTSQTRKARQARRAPPAKSLGVGNPTAEPLPGTGRQIVVVGQGYVGLPLSLAASQAGYDVVGVDLNAARVEELNAGHSPIGDVDEEDLGKALDAERYRATTSFVEVKQAEVVVICVPTPCRGHVPDLTHVESAAREIAAHLRPGTLVVLESTTYPGTTEEVLVPSLEAGSGLRAGVDFEVAFSPERIDPGNPTFGVHNTPKVVGGMTPRATALAADFYGQFVEQVVTVSSPAAAEMAKLLENTFRQVNIALVNEIARHCHDLGIDVWEVVAAAASKPFGFMAFRPGPGVGGHCIPVDPLYLAWKVRQSGSSARFIELAHEINAGMPAYCTRRVQDLLNERGLALKGASVLVLGVAYKANISDVRESPALPLIEELSAKGANVSYHDPHVPSVSLAGGVELASIELGQVLDTRIDCAILVTPHAGIDYADVASRVGVFFDTRGALEPDAHVSRL